MSIQSASTKQHDKAGLPQNVPGTQPSCATENKQTPQSAPLSSDASNAENLKSSDTSQSQENAPRPSGQYKSSGVYDLSDPNAVELLIEDENIPVYDSEKGREIHDAQKTLLSVELSRQKGVEISGNKVTVPGRVSLTLITLLETLFCVLGFATGIIHFSIMSPNYILAVIVMSVILFLQIVIYHSSYRAMRKAMTAIHAFGTVGIMILCSWAFIDHILYPPKADMPFFILCVSLFNFILIPVLMLVHFFWLGRGSRQIKLKQKKSTPKISKQIKSTIAPLK